MYVLVFWAAFDHYLLFLNTMLELFTAGDDRDSIYRRRLPLPCRASRHQPECGPSFGALPCNPNRGRGKWGTEWTRERDDADLSTNLLLRTSPSYWT